MAVPDLVIEEVIESGVLLRSASGVLLRPARSGVFRPSWGENFGIRDFFSIWFGVDDLVRGDGALLLPVIYKI